MSAPFADRVRACKRHLERRDADAVVLFPSPNTTYLTGFDETPSERVLFGLVSRTADPTIVAPELYAGALEESWVDDVRLWGDATDPWELVDTALTDHGVRRQEPPAERSRPAPGGEAGDRARRREATLLVDDTMWAAFTEPLRALRPNATVELASSVVGALRARKDASECEALRRAGAIADRIAVEVRERGSTVVGTSERDLAREIDRLLEEAGGTAPAFETIVASGPNGARPHHRPGDRRIEAGEPVVLDFGAFVPATYDVGVGYYPGDQTRTIVFDGEPSAKARRVHEVVRRAQQAAVDIVEPGVTAGEVDHAARTVIDEAGYGDAFVHRTGHGVGLEVHEPPYIVAGNDRELEAGMVFSVEPGIYLEGEFGVRLEDLVLVTDDGCERINESPRGLLANGS
ncbi:M24 family metallopeptidase [Natronobiforma cellulositropha]|uniref:M24 family metallopeptidase n=1 Tax=Natronobiforma cellulositropha TaxID=1679076 RepID=UPI0021D579A8|nr:aminopeptidase P family protein [Natronobiforma cellulositropha]